MVMGAGTGGGGGGGEILELKRFQISFVNLLEDPEGKYFKDSLIFALYESSF